MNTSSKIASRKLPVYAISHAAIMVVVALLVLALANWRVVDDVLVTIITFGGNFWPPAILAALAATFPMAKAFADGEEENFSRDVAITSLMVCMIAGRGAWLTQPGFSGTALEAWSMGAICVLAVINALWCLMAFLERSDR
jgi:hypothetical protein